jgi:TetR/AcrR family transcriptional repressor of nem operon
MRTGPSAREKLLDAATTLIRRDGFAATSVDDLCGRAGVTKGAFFHHFADKRALGVAAATYWHDITAPMFAAAPYHRPRDPLARILAYLDFRKELLRGKLAEYTCLVGTLAQEVHNSHPDIRDACGAAIAAHAEILAKDFRAAMKLRKAPAGVTAESLALHTQVVLQGAFVLAKARNDVKVAQDAIDHLKRYIRAIFKEKKERPQ